MRYLLVVLLLLTAACGSNSKKSENHDEEAMLIKLPETPKDLVGRSPFFNTQKIILSRPNGFEYEFYYGGGGRYIVVVKPPKETYVDFSKSEATLTVGAGELNPEIISLDVDGKGIFQGNGDPRDGQTNFNFQLLVPASRFNGALNESIDFKIKIKSSF